MMNQKIKTRFAPSPTGYLHVGGARTALFNFLWARHCGGQFLLRIEDTDRERHVEGADQKIVNDLRWLGIEWDEGFAKGGPNGPYVQSQRLEIYQKLTAKLLAEGKAYYAFETSDQLDALRTAAEARKESFRYSRPAELVTDPEQAAHVRNQGRPAVVRIKNPGQDVTIHDELFGDVTVAATEQDDFVIVKDDGFPTYHLAVTIDDGLMGINFIMRGQEFLSQTWRQNLLRKALGFPEPQYAHLPLIMDMAGRKLSKRDGDVEVHAFRRAGYLPEVLANFIALLGWNPGGDHEKMTLAEMIQLFTPDRLNKANAKFDRAKLLAFNTEALASASEDRLVDGFADFLSVQCGSVAPAVSSDVGPAGSSAPAGGSAGGMPAVGPAGSSATAGGSAGGTPPTQSEPAPLIPANDRDLLRRLIRTHQGFRTYADIVAKSGVLFGPDDAYAFDEKAVAKVLAKNDNAGYAVLADLRPLLAAAEWAEDALKAVIEGYCQAKSIGMGQAAQPIRVAVTGTTVSPAIYDTLLFLGKAKTLARIDRCLRSKS